MRIEVKREELGKVIYRMPGKCLLEPSAAVLPPELEGVLDNPLDQLEGLLDLGLSQRSEVHHPHIHLRTRDENTHTDNSVTVRPGDHFHKLLPLE